MPDCDSKVNSYVLVYYRNVPTYKVGRPDRPLAAARRPRRLSLPNYSYLSRTVSCLEFTYSSDPSAVFFLHFTSRNDEKDSRIRIREWTKDSKRYWPCDIATSLYLFKGVEYRPCHTLDCQQIWPSKITVSSISDTMRRNWLFSNRPQTKCPLG